MGTTYLPMGNRDPEWYNDREAPPIGEYQCVDGGTSLQPPQPDGLSMTEAQEYRSRPINTRPHQPITVLMVAVFVLCLFHVLLGLVAVAVGVTASIQADVWLAHTVSPIWSGVFFIITASLGFASIKAKTPYMAMCFTAFSIVSMVVAIISIQLLRLGLVNHTTDGHTFVKEKKDLLILIALGVTGGECLFSLASAVLSLRVLKQAREEAGKKREGVFHLQVLSQKEVVLVSKTSSGKQKITSV